MSKNQRRAKANERASQQKRTAALQWPHILTRFADWLIHSDCAADPFTAHWMAMAVDRSARERKIVVLDSDFPLRLFDLEDYTSYYVDDCGHAPWTHEDYTEAVILFMRFVVAENISPAQVELLTEKIDCHGPLRQSLPSSTPPHLSVPIGPMELTSYLQDVACWCEDNRTVPAADLAYPTTSAQIRRQLDHDRHTTRGAVEELLSVLRYRWVIATALNVGIVGGSGRQLDPGTEFESWLSTPNQKQLHESLVHAYSACLDPMVELDNQSEGLELRASAVGLWYILVRSVVGDPVRNGEPISSSTAPESKNAGHLLTVWCMIMVGLGLIVVVNGKLCVPDSHVPALREALGLRGSARWEAKA